MSDETNCPLPRLQSLSISFPLDGAVRIELEEGALVFKASHLIQNRIEALIRKQRDTYLNTEDETELNQYEEMDDFLSFVNRVVRNLMQSENFKDS